ncbi:MAG: hypothetical protein IRY89_11445 [Pseudolabrys sp.]|nr:hypothetical protein [Pseudolabrys sp.]
MTPIAILADLLRRPALLLALALPLLAACNTDQLAGTGAPLVAAREPAAKPEQEPMTHTRAARECWMATEKGRADMPLDKRADVVEKCIEQKMKAAAAPQS